MARHYNIYYLFQEDKERNPMREEKALEIQKNIENFYKKIKPPWPVEPPISRREETPGDP